MPSKSSRRKDKNGYSNHHSNTKKNGLIKLSNHDKNRADDGYLARGHSDYNHYDPDTDPITDDPKILTEAISDIFSSGAIRNVSTMRRKTMSKSSSKRRHHKHKRRGGRSITCCGFTLCHFSGRNCCTSMSFMASFLLLFIEFVLIASSITDNRPLFMSYRINTDESMSMETEIDDIDPMKLYRWTHLEVYSFRDDPGFESVSSPNPSSNSMTSPSSSSFQSEEELVYAQMLEEGEFDPEEDDIHSDSYFNHYQSTKQRSSFDVHSQCGGDTEISSSSSPHHPLRKGYRFVDEDAGYFLTIYEWALREQVLAYTIFKNLVGFIVLVLSIVSPSMARNLYIVVFICCSVTNTCLAMMDPNFYIAFTKTGVSWYKKSVYHFYANHSVRILLGFAFAQHLISSVFWLKNLSVIMRIQREAERSALKSSSSSKKQDDGIKGDKRKVNGDGNDDHKGTEDGDGKSSKKSKKKGDSKKKRKMERILKREHRMMRDRVRVPGWMYTVSLLLGILNFAVLIPLGVDWNQFGVVWFSSSAISFTAGLVILLLSHCGILMDEKERRKRDRRRKSAKSAAKLSKLMNTSSSSTKHEGGKLAKIKLPDNGDGNGQGVKKAMFILWKRAENGEPAKMRTLAVDEIAAAEWKDDEEEDGKDEDNMLALRDGHDDGVIEADECEKENGKKKEKNGMKHKKKVTLMDGRVMKCQCNKCLSRREKRRKQRKKMKLLKQMQRCQGE